MAILLLISVGGCDNGLAPTGEVEPDGNLIVNISYTGEWPPQDEIFEFRFVAFPFIPETVNDIFFGLDDLLISDNLNYGAESQTVVFENVQNETFVYSAIAWQFGENVLQDWQAAGAYEQPFTIEGNTVEIDMLVDFDNLPPFPPEPQGGLQ